jgi:hypothetical protein
MLTGFNTNFRHRGILFHVQTEDSGTANPHVITHLFHGGNILSSQKQDYTAKLESETLEDDVRGLMEQMHKAMLHSLKDGEHDGLILERLGATCFEDSGSDTASTMKQNAPEQPAPAPAETSKERIARAFGEGSVTEKPLDEVVLDYLVQNARKRKKRPQ